MPGMLLVTAEFRPALDDVFVMIWASPMLSPGIEVPPVRKMRLIAIDIMAGGAIGSDYGLLYEEKFGPIVDGYCVWVGVQAVSGDPNAGGINGGIRGQMVYSKSQLIA